MAAFEWMELQTLTGEITEARSRLAEARSAKDQRRVRALEQEIAAAERRRAGLLAFLTDHLADTEPPSQSANEDTPPAADAEDDNGGREDNGGSVVAAETGAPIVGEPDAPGTSEALATAAADNDVAVAAGEDAPVATVDEMPVTHDDIVAAAADPADQSGREAAAAADAANPSTVKGETIVWEQLTPGDIERAERELTQRRDEMLARHAEELKTLDAERERLTTLEQAIAEFIKSFGPPAGGEVVQLGDEREMRAQGRG